MDKDRILTIYLGRKGAGNTYSYEMVKALLGKGKKILCLLSIDIENKKNWDELQGVHQDLNVKYIKTYKSRLGFLLSLLFARIKYNGSLKYIYDFNPTHIYIPMISLLTSFFIRNFNIPIITTIHDVNQHLGEENGLIAHLNNKVIKKSSSIIVLSERFKNLVADKFKKDIRNIHYIPHANFSIYAPDDYEPNFKDIKYNILFFGRIHKYKGLEVLLKALRIVKNKFPKIKLSIVGNGKLTEKENTLIDQLGNSVICNIRWISDDEIHNFFKDIDFTVLPYIEASQSGVIPLSYSFGKSVVASDIGGLAEQIFDGTGIIVKPGDDEELADMIINLYNDTDRILEMNRAAYSVSNTLLSWDYSGELLSEVIRNTKTDKICDEKSN